MNQKAIFITEDKHRFSCIVDIDGVEETCYVASSSKFKHFIDLTNRKVWLRNNAVQKRKSQYTLYSVEHENTRILLELSEVNKLVINYLKSEDCPTCFKGIITSEKKLSNGYKPDLIIEQQNKTLLVEAKAVLGIDGSPLFPSLIAKRALLQLEKIEELIKEGYEVYYWLVLINPNSFDCEINLDFKEFVVKFNRCLQIGMKVISSTVICDIDGDFKINSYVNKTVSMTFNDNTATNSGDKV